MLGSTVLEVAIGLVFCFASVALITSSVQEAVSSLLQTRSKDLLTNIKRLLNAEASPAGKELLLGLYNHALIHPSGSGSLTSPDELSKRENRPEYIGAKNFAIAFIDTIDSTQSRWGELGGSIDKIENPQLQKLLRGMRERVQGDVQQLQAEIAAWFDTAMNQASGAYKRKAQAWCFIYALVIAIVFNIDSVHLFKTLWQQPVMAAQIADAAASSNAQAPLQELKVLPIGWTDRTPWDRLQLDWSLLPQIVGWLITATAALFGAPFWFDLLQQLVRLRGTGPKPPPSNETKTDNPSAPPPATMPSTTAPLATERNAIVDMHAARNKDDPSYRPLQPGERW